MGSHDIPDGRDQVGPADNDRQETESERSDRNWIDLLQELRVLQAGTQILTAFLLAIAFQPRFTDLDEFQRTLYLALVSVSILTTILSLLPVSLHRLLFRRRLKSSTVAIGDAMVRAVVLGVSLGTVGTAMLIFDFVVGRVAGLLAAGILALVLLAFGVFLPLIVRRRSSPDPQSRN
ncbi:hypothetical protein L1277_000938 [Okibacterium sp. HSC-33S16]|uniref:DUF6328 family protein n=1 Tax=Okibacterium sp. HSC-33S16 TaxID=2910965 RepID=UPI00209C791B|nr:DUF6328 family protein [Okibacterium sp. HSC-33S16]MCP2030874.1 hypothetical protein [Okibacterium sp. HSC-33S16]